LIYGQDYYDAYDDEVTNIGADFAFGKFTISADYYNASYRDSYTNTDIFEELDAVVKYKYGQNTELHLGVAHAFIEGKDISKAQLGIIYKIK